jgi:SAM-dependent methyltransferase
MTFTSPIYWSPTIYRAVMRALYGPALGERYRAVGRLIPDNARVVELCCGCGYLYEHYLRRRGIEYHGFDLLPVMLSRLRRIGAHVEQADVATAPLPPADFVIMIGSLYHFHPHEPRILQKMAAAGTGIVLEPTQNLSQSTNPVIRLVARITTFISGTSSAYRLTSQRLEEALAEAGVRVLSRDDVLQGRYRLVVFQRGR